MSKLLVIDDCEIHHFIMDKMLERDGLFEGREKCLNAEAAIKQLENDSLDEDKLPDVIFLDLVMPGFNGFDFLDRFNKLRQLIQKTIHVVVFTCSVIQADRTKAEEYGFVDGFVVKPVSMQALQGLASVYDNTLQLT